LTKRGALEEFHHQERPLKTIDSIIVDTHDMSVGEPRRVPCFLFEAAGQIKRATDTLSNELHCYRTFENNVNTLVDGAHSSPS